MRIKIKVHADSSKEDIKKTSDNGYEVWLKEKPKDNKANIALVKSLKKFFKSEVEIKSGFNSRNKIVEVE